MLYEYKGFKCYFYQDVINSKGKVERLLHFSKGNYNDGFYDLRALESEYKLLIDLGMSNNNKYKLSDLPDEWAD